MVLLFGSMLDDHNMTYVSEQAQCRQMNVDPGREGKGVGRRMRADFDATSRCGVGIFRVTRRG